MEIVYESLPHAALDPREDIRPVRFVRMSKEAAGARMHVGEDMAGRVAVLFDQLSPEEQAEYANDIKEV